MIVDDGVCVGVTVIDAVNVAVWLGDFEDELLCDRVDVSVDVKLGV